MSDSVPHSVLALAVFVNFLSFLAVFLGLLLCFMLWRHGEGLSYILLLSVGTTLGAIQGVVIHIDYTLNWRQIQNERYEQSQKTHYNQTAMFGKSDTGWRSVFGWLGIYLYNFDSLLVLSWAITLFIGTWNIRMKPTQKRIMAVVFKTTAIILPAIMVGVCQIRVLSKYPFLFLVVVNIIMTVSMVSGFVLVLAILYRYLMTRSVFKRFFGRNSSLARGSLSLGTVSTVTTGTRSGDRRTTDKLLIIRFSIIMIILIIFEVALIVYELVNFQRNRRNQASHTKCTGPDLSVEQARIDLYQYIPGVVPSIVAFCIFGTTATFRTEYKEALMACCCCCFYPHGSSRSIFWRSAQSQSYGRQRSIDVEASQRDRSVSMDINAGIAVEVKTEISLTPISSIEPAAMRPRRVSFSGTSVIPDRSDCRSNTFNTHGRSFFSPQRLSRQSALGASPRCSGNPSPTPTRRSQSQVTQMRQHSIGKALPPLPPQATSPDQGVSPANPNPTRMDLLDITSAQEPSWLSTDSKSSLIDADTGRSLSQ